MSRHVLRWQLAMKADRNIAECHSPVGSKPCSPSSSTTMSAFGPPESWAMGTTPVPHHIRLRDCLRMQTSSRCNGSAAVAALDGSMLCVAC